MLDRLGGRIMAVGSAMLLFLGDLVLTLARGLAPGRWRRTMRVEFERYFYLIGVRAIPAVVATGLLVGISLVLQIIYWLEVTGQKGSIGDFLVAVLIREIAPFVTALIAIGRSGSVMLDEVGHLRVNGQIRMLESYGIDPFDFIAVPRCFAMSAALFVLTIIFLYAALWSGYLGASLAGLTLTSLVEFADEVLSGMELSDHLSLLIKPIVTGFVIAHIAIWLGMRAGPGVLDVRRLLPRGFLYALLATLSIGIGVSAMV